jgi:hypothetical protein
VIHGIIPTQKVEMGLSDPFTTQGSEEDPFGLHPEEDSGKNSVLSSLFAEGKRTGQKVRTVRLDVGQMVSLWSKQEKRYARSMFQNNMRGIMLNQSE